MTGTAALISSAAGIARSVAGRVTASYRRQGFGVEYDDVLSGALWGVWKAAETYDPERGTAFTSWAFPYAKRYAVLAARRDAGLTSRGDGEHVRSLDAIREADDEADRDPVDDEADGDHLAGRIAVRDAVAALPEREREVVFLTYWRGLGPTAVGEEVGLSKSGARVVLERAHSALREHLRAA